MNRTPRTMNCFTHTHPKIQRRSVSLRRWSHLLVRFAFLFFHFFSGSFFVEIMQFFNSFGLAGNGYTLAYIHLQATCCVCNSRKIASTNGGLACVQNPDCFSSWCAFQGLLFMCLQKPANKSDCYKMQSGLVGDIYLGN